MTKYNILYIHNKSEISGGERSLLGLWENLDKQIFSIVLMVPSEGSFSRQAGQLGIKVIYYSLPQLRPWHIFGVTWALTFLRKVILQEQVHLIHSHTARNNIMASMVGRLMNIPVIWHERNILMKGEMDITKMLLFLPGAVICNSKAVARHFGELPSKVKVILNGVDLNRFKPVTADVNQKLTVGIVSNLNVRRRIEYFMEAAKAIHAQELNVVFFIVGGEFEKESKGRQKELEIYAHQLGLGECLFFTGTQEDVRPWIAMFDVSCHVTSLDACSRSVLEAMSMARAIVAMNDGGNPELIENNQSGILVDPFDQNGFVNAVLSLLGDTEKRKKLGNAARMRAEEYFDIKRNAQETQELYLQCLKDK